MMSAGRIMALLARFDCCYITGSAKQSGYALAIAVAPRLALQ